MKRDGVLSDVGFGVDHHYLRYRGSEIGMTMMKHDDIPVDVRMMLIVATN